jgi:hypothetical protein
MTARPVLEDPNLAQQIVTAFSVVSNGNADDHTTNP